MSCTLYYSIRVNTLRKAYSGGRRHTRTSHHTHTLCTQYIAITRALQPRPVADNTSRAVQSAHKITRISYSAVLPAAAFRFSGYVVYTKTYINFIIFYGAAPRVENLVGAFWCFVYIEMRLLGGRAPCS